MDNIIYSKRHFVIFRSYNGFIVYNTKKSFNDGHTHLNSFNSAKYIIALALNGKVPNDLDRYRLVSLMRITDSLEYKGRIERLLENKNKKDHYKYYNSRRKAGVQIA